MTDRTINKMNKWMNNWMSMVMLDKTKGWYKKLVLFMNELINFWMNCMLCINKWKIWFIN